MSNLPRVLVVALLMLAGCQTTTGPAHQFSEPAANWQSKNGQLAYADPHVSLIGEVLVRYSKSGDFELTFTKAGGLTLLTLRQDATFGKAEGPLARRGWSGPLANAPQHLRGWFELRDKVVNWRGGSLHHMAGDQTFTLHF